MTKKIIVKADSQKYFDDQEKARKYAIKLLEAGLTYLKIEDDD